MKTRIFVTLWVSAAIIALGMGLAPPRAEAPPIPLNIPRIPLVVEAKASAAAAAIAGLRDGQTLRLVGGGWATIPEIFRVVGRKGIRIIAAEPVALVGGQLSFERCERVLLENVRIYPHGERTPGQIAAYVEKTGGFDGRALVITDCLDVTVRNCTFAACTDDMAGVGGASARIVYERCLFACPLGIYGQGFLGTTGKPLRSDIPEWLTMRGCVFYAFYRCPKIEGGVFALERCIMAAMHYRPLELKAPRGTIAGCWFAPMTACDARPIIMAGEPSAGLTLAGNRLYGRPAGWAELVGMPGRSPIDRQNIVAMTPLDREIATGAAADGPTFADILAAAGTRGEPDDIERMAKWAVGMLGQ